MGTEMFQQNSTSELEASGSFLKTWSPKDESLKQVTHSYIPPGVRECHSRMWREVDIVRFEFPAGRYLLPTEGSTW